MLVAPLLKTVAAALVIAVGDRAMAPPHVPEAKEHYNSSRLGRMGRVLLFEGHRVCHTSWSPTLRIIDRPNISARCYFG